MTTIVVLFNLKSGVDVAQYEQWARDRDLPTVNGLASVDQFEVLRSAGLLMGEGEPPYGYVELIRVNDMDKFGADVSSEAVQKVAAEFGQFADNPLFIMTEAL